MNHNKTVLIVMPPRHSNATLNRNNEILRVAITPYHSSGWLNANNEILPITTATPAW